MALGGPGDRLVVNGSAPGAAPSRGYDCTRRIEVSVIAVTDDCDEKSLLETLIRRRTKD